MPVAPTTLPSLDENRDQADPDWESRSTDEPSYDADAELLPDDRDGGNDSGDGEDDDGDNGGGGDDYRDNGGRWVTVATFWLAPEAHIARLRLESEGIDCVIVDENLVATDWLFANAVGGIKLQVPADQAVRARETLAPAAGRPAADAAGEPLYDGQARCPRCGSDDVFRTPLSRRAAFLCILFLGAPLPLLRPRTRCAACGFEWK